MIQFLFFKGSNTVVKCIIKRGCQDPSWQINNKNVSKEKLLKFAQNLQIQPNNLCQFLPQVILEYEIKRKCFI